MSNSNDSVAPAGRVLIAVLFLMAATQGFIASVGLPLLEISHFGAIAVEVLGSVLLITGLRARRLAVAHAATAA